MLEIFSPRNVIAGCGLYYLVYFHSEYRFYRPGSLTLPIQHLPVTRLERKKLGRTYRHGEYVTRSMFEKNNNRLP
ncbi:hypothetical protein ANTQUA_LOCUS6295 [Anthophora quadrimaculata]